MIVIDNTIKDKLECGTYIALGSFDGLHLGHMSLINTAINKAKENNVKSMIYTFKNHPLTIVNKSIAPKLIMDNERKIQLLERQGVDIACMVEFNKDLMKVLPEDFVKDLCYRFNARGIVVGFNYKFGYKNSGNVELLKELSLKYNFELIVMKAFKNEDDIISSSRIRNLISSGNIEEANSMLLEPYMLKGKVIQGKKNGKKMGFPTANLDIDFNYVIPERGVYYTNVQVKNKIYRGITSVGYNPTLNGDKLTIETYILDFNEDIYGEDIKVYFIEKTREEINFPSIEALIEQLRKDESLAKSKNLYINI